MDDVKAPVEINGPFNASEPLSSAEAIASCAVAKPLLRSPVGLEQTNLNSSITLPRNAAWP